MIEAGEAVTRSARDNAHATDRCSLRVVVLADSPPYGDVPCNIPWAVGLLLV